MTVIVDTNVPKVANQESEQASGACIVRCTEEIEAFRNGDYGRLVLDDQWQIIKEYKANLQSSGQPGVGDAFLRWVLTNHTNQDLCWCVPIHPLPDGTSFEEFPDDAALARFDKDDRKFVAVAKACVRAHNENPTIWNAVDPHWWIARRELQANDLNIRFLCEDDVRRLAAGK
jgi:hypothetical protein